jgi:hypothetical protein
LQLVTGFFEATADDSALVYSTAGDVWTAVKVSKAWNDSASWASAPSGGDMPVCFWGDSTVSAPRPQAAVELQGDSTVLAGLRLGTPVHAFRRTEYGLAQQDGRWWLGRRVGAAGSFDIITGPLLPPGEGGLVFTYYDSTGAVTNKMTEIAEVGIVIRAESLNGTPGAANGMLRDSLTLRVMLRGNAP